MHIDLENCSGSSYWGFTHHACKSFHEITQKKTVFTNSRKNFMFFTHHAWKSFHAFTQIFFGFHAITQLKRANHASRRPMGGGPHQNFLVWEILKIRAVSKVVEPACEKHLPPYRQKVTKFLASDKTFCRLKFSNPLFSIVIFGKWLKFLQVFVPTHIFADFFVDKVHAFFISTCHFPFGVDSRFSKFEAQVVLNRCSFGALLSCFGHLMSPANQLLPNLIKTDSIRLISIRI